MRSNLNLRSPAIFAQFLRRFDGAFRGLVVALMFVFAAFGSAGQPAAGAVAPPAQENRYLIVVDVSKAMLPRAPGSLEAIGELLATGMDGQIRQGDALALWTFSEDLYAGRFPIQHWSAADQGMIGSRVLTFLRDQTIGKVANLDKVMLAASYVIKDSQCLTMIVITDGDAKFHGTPFDNQINESFARLGKKQKKAKMPFVVVLRSEKGVLKDFSVSTPPRPIRVPEVPPLAPAPQPSVQLTKAAPATTPAAAPEIKNLVPGAIVFSGVNPKPMVVPDPAEPAPAAQPAKVESVAKVVAQPAAPAAPTVPTNNAPALAVKGEVPQAPVTPSAWSIETPKMTLENTSDSAQAEPASPTLPPAEVASGEKTAPAPPPTPPAATAVATPVVNPAPVPKPEPAKVAEPKMATPEPAHVAAVAEPPVSKPSPKPVQNETPKLSVTPETKTAAAPAPAAAPAAVAAVAPAVPASLHPGELRPVNARPHPHATPAAAHAQVGMVAPGSRWASGWTFWAAAVLLVATAMSCSLLILRRSRPASSGSLITCSFDRNKRG